MYQWYSVILYFYPDIDDIAQAEVETITNACVQLLIMQIIAVQLFLLQIPEVQKIGTADLGQGQMNVQKEDQGHLISPEPPLPGHHWVEIWMTSWPVCREQVMWWAKKSHSLNDQA